MNKCSHPGSARFTFEIAGQYEGESVGGGKIDWCSLCGAIRFNFAIESEMKTVQGFQKDRYRRPLNAGLAKVPTRKP